MNYKESTLSGSTWVRCRSIVLSNPLAGEIEKTLMGEVALTPKVQFQEEKIISIDGENNATPCGACCKVFDPTATIPLLDPTNGVPTGELSLIHISEPTRLGMISYAVFCLKKKN